ncbi:MAG TPA: serine hydrolase domain-containing protein [Ktedonobacteraceae bacterium]|jgi:CubicO group peptidase (beta-lactamase class C family)
MTPSSRTARTLTFLAPLIACLLVACGAPGSIPHSTSPTTRTTPGSADEVNAYLSHLAASGDLTGSVLVARGDTVLLSKGYGLADEERQIPNTPQTRFRIGSNTKQFTAMAILILQEQRKLHVQDHLCLYITECPQDWQPITLHHLLTHTSGIEDYINSPEFPPLIGTPATPEELVARFKDKPLLFPPGTRWSYSNSGYTLLGYIIEKVSGESYAQFLAEHIFGPLQMHDTGYDTNDPQPPAHATGYLSEHNKPVYLDMSEFYAAGALYSTVEDLYKWDQALLTHQLVSQQTMDAMFKVYIPCPDGGCALSSDEGYGYGWFIASESNHRLVYHWGRIDGFRTSNGFYPEDHVIVVLLSNLETTDVWGISDHLGQMVLGIE